MARVSSGMKITGAQDDAAGFAISERMRVRIRALDQANQNTQNDSALMKTAEGAVGNTIDILKALKEKCINAANDSNTDEDRQTIQKEIDQYIDQIDDNALVTFNGKYLLDGSKNNAAVATKTILLNQSLAEGTLAADELTTLKNRAGDSLNIQETDYFQVSWVQNGEIHTTSGQVGTNSIANILSLNGLGDQATVAATSVDSVTGKGGLIGVSETGLVGYAKTGAKAYNASGLSADDVANMFRNDTNLNSVVNATTVGSLADGEKITISGYGSFNTDTAPEIGDITITASEVSTGVFTYTVEGIANTDATNADTAVDLYRKTAPTETSAQSDGTPKTGETGYIDAPTDASAKITATGTAGTNNFGLTEIPTTVAVASTATYSLADLGYYTVTGLDDNNKPTGYKAAEGTVTVAQPASGTYTYNFDGDTPLGADLYHLDAAQVADTTVTVDKNGTILKEFSDIPKTITVVKDPDPNVPLKKDVPDKYNKDVFTPDNASGLAVVAKTAGVDKQISGLTISILDQDLNVKKAANAALDQFKQYQRAENETGDKSMTFHIGSEANQAIKVGLTDMRAQALGLKGSDGTRINVFTKENANASINVIENALTKALDQQTTIGAVESRLEYTSTNLTTASENVQASESTIRDADMAKEMTNYTKANVLLQAAQAMLAQANQSSSSVLSLLQ
jgi:flagellin